jgi:amino acid permease
MKPYDGEPEVVTNASSPSRATEVGQVEEGIKGPNAETGGLHRGLSARQVQMIAIGACLLLMRCCTRFPADLPNLL